MPRYLMLLKFTERGVGHIKDSPSRASTFKAAAARLGAVVEGQFWLLGEYDGAVLFTAPDEQAAAALTLGLGSQDNVHTCLCRAFDEAEFKSVLAKV